MLGLAKSKAKPQIQIVVTRADGSVHDFGNAKGPFSQRIQGWRIRRYAKRVRQGS